MYLKQRKLQRNKSLKKILVFKAEKEIKKKIYDCIIAIKKLFANVKVDEWNN